MTALWIILGILGFFLLVALLPVGAECRYDGEASVKLLVGPFKITLVPEKPKNRKKREKEAAKKAKKKAEKPKKDREKKAKKLIARKKKEEAPKEPLKDKIAGLVPFAKLAVSALGTLKRKLLVKYFFVDARIAGADPAKTAETTGYAWTAIGAMRPILLGAFRIRKTEVSVRPDFLADRTDVRAGIALRFLVGDLVALAVKYGIRALKLLKQRKKHLEELKAVQKNG